MASKGARFDNHAIKIDQIPRWIEQEPTISADTLRHNGLNGHTTSLPPGASSGPDTAAASGPDTGAALAPPPPHLDPLSSTPSSSGFPLSYSAGFPSSSSTGFPGFPHPQSAAGGGGTVNHHSGGGGGTVILEPSASFGDADLLRKSYSSPFHDPLTLKPRGLPGLLTSVGEGQGHSWEGGGSKFPVDPAVNSRVLLWRGDPWTLEVDVVVNSTNEAMDASSSSANLHAEAGPGLAEE